jgi:hypothetical protein
MKKIKSLVMLMAAAILLLACSGDEPELSSDKTVTSFTFKASDNPGLETDIAGSFTDDAIQFSLPPGVAVTSLVPTIVLPSGISITPTSGVPMDFSDPVTYTVTAQDKTRKDYSVTVAVQPSSEKTITSFKFSKADNPTLQQDANATISGLEIVCTLPAGVSLNVLKPSIEFNGASISPGSGIAADFTTPVTYTVIAEDGTVQNYIVQVMQSSGPTVYVAGSIRKFGSFYGTLWKNGVETSLTNGVYNTFMTSLFVKDEVVHASGNMSIGNSVASSWRIENETQMPAPRLNETSNDGYANSIFVSESNDIYIAGHEFKNMAGFVAKVWKNGTMTQLTENFGAATGVSVSGNDVYVSGYEADEDIIYAKLWKNGVATILTPDDARAHAKCVFTSGPDVYVAIQSFNESDASIKVWKNGNVANVTTSGYADVHSIFVLGNDVYLAGFSIRDNQYNATLWVNGVPSFLSDNPGSEARSVYVHDGDVYVVGFEPQEDGTNTAVLWKNGVPAILSTNALANAIVVK